MNKDRRAIKVILVSKVLKVILVLRALKVYRVHKEILSLMMILLLNS